MRLNPHAREFYALQITTEPAVTDWEASFDHGTTWVEGDTATIGAVTATRWLVAGPLAPVDEPVAAILAGSVTPLVRAITNSEVLVEDAPRISLA